MTAPSRTAGAGAATPFAAVLTAAGSGSRFGSALPKALVPLGGVPLVAHAARRLAEAGATRIVVTAPPGRASAVVEALLGVGLAEPTFAVVDGGPSRQASVAAALAALEPSADVVLVHDAARALAPVSLIRRVADAVLAGHAAVVPGLPVTDTIKEVRPGPEGERVVGTPDRARLRAVQTPQGFRRALLEQAHAAGLVRAGSEASAATDDAALVEALGEPVWVVPGDPLALKITTPLDLAFAELLRTVVAGADAAGPAR